MKFLPLGAAFLLLLLATTSCHYRLYKAIDANGKKHWIRGYKNYKREHRYYDKLTVKYHYKPENYAIDPTCVSKTDTSIDCDSLKLYVNKDAWQYAPLFINGLIPCKQIGIAYGKLSDLPGVEKIPGKPVIDTGVKNLIIYDFHRLGYIRANRRHRFYQFHVLPYWYYIELTNNKARRKKKTADFFKNAHLTWMYRSNVIDL